VRRYLLASATGALALLLPAAAAATGQYPVPVNAERPTLMGAPAVGQTLSCSQGTWQNASSYSYTWLRDGAPILTAAGSTYTVQAADQGHGISCQVTASAGGGEYTISSLPSGSYQVRFIPGFRDIPGLQENIFTYQSANPDYLEQFFSGQSSASTAEAVPVTAQNTTANIDAALQVGGQIMGKVTNASGIPLAQIAVCPVGPYSCGVSNSSDEYSIKGLPTGSYEVLFIPFCAGEAWDCQGKPNYLWHAYGTNVPVTAPNTTSGIDLVLEPGGQITGRVTSPSAVPLANIVACSHEAQMPEVVECSLTNANGEYTVNGLHTGSYTVELFPNNHEREPETNYLEQSYKSEEILSVTAGSTVSDINTVMQIGGKIAGTVTAADTGAPLPHIRACVETWGRLGSWSGYVEYCSTTNSNGEYAIQGLASGAGQWGVHFFPCWKAACTQNYLPGEHGPVSATPGSVVLNVNVALQSGGEITGKVTNSSGTPLANILACPHSMKVVTGACAATNDAGEYAIMGMYTGEYTIEFETSQCLGGYCSAQQNYLNQSVQGVSVIEGSATPNVDATMSAGGQISGTVTSADGTPLQKVEVCAEDASGNGGYEYCTTTTGAGGSASATSNTLTIPAATPPTTSNTTTATEQSKTTIKHKTPTASQKLARALRACKKIKRTSKRRKCEARARKRYAPKRKTGRRHHRRS
jgi:hypothetical protein